jgi:formylglycine-generating enzyme required for sulfatase activity
MTDSASEKLEEVGRVLRGGSLHGNRRFTRCAYRVGGDPRHWYFYVGFRCARGSQ